MTDISNDAILHLSRLLDREVTTQFLADKFRALLADREALRLERDKYMAAYDAAVDEQLHDQMQLRDAGDESDRLRAERDRLMGALLAWLYANDVGDEQKRADAVAYARSVVRDADT
jgi:hypothetical protein